jgi:homopolymeric O-antigen transport system ATP-binding protein
MPFRAYSAGMRARLDFAISTAIEAEILLLDEGLGAGDASFIEKANARLLGLAEAAGIVVVATHSEAPLAQDLQDGRPHGSRTHSGYGQRGGGA